MSVLAIGLAGEYLVRFACLVNDGGFMPAHNCTGAVMSSEKLKAIIVERGTHSVSLNKNSDILYYLKEGPEW